MSLSFQDVLEKFLRRPWIVILAFTAITVLLAAAVPRLSFKTSVYDLIIEDLPENVRYGEFKSVFGSDEIIRVVIKAENIFDPLTFKKIEQLSAASAEIKGVRRVISLPEVRKAVDITGTGDLDKFAQVLEPVELFQRNLYSTNHKSTVLTLVLTTDAIHSDVISDINAMIQGQSQELSLYQIGMPLVSEAMSALTEKDFFRLPPITFALIALMLLLLYRKILYVILPLACVTMALVWTFGLIALSGVPLSMLTMIVPVFLIAVGTAYCLHIVSEYLTRADQSEDRHQAVRKAYAKITFPTVLAIFTTVIGLGSLLVSRITAIQEFAIFAILGICSFLVVLLFFMPAMMTLLPMPKAPGTFGVRIEKLLDRILYWVVRLVLDYQRFTLPVLAIIIAVCLVGIFRIRVETNPVGFFKSDVPVNQHFHDIYRDLSGSFPVNVMMANTAPDYFEKAQHIAQIAQLQQFIDTLPGVDKTISFADYMKLVNYASNRFEAEYYKLPEEDFEVRMLINSYRMMLGEDMLQRFMASDFSKSNILLLTHISSSRAFLDLRDAILDHATQEFSKDLKWDVTGFGMVISESSHQLTSGQIKSLSITMVLVFAIMYLLFLSSKVGLVAIVPNLFPIIVNFGIMGWLGIELSMFTSLIASVAIGLAVDDTIHYLVRYNSEFRQDLDDKRALRETIRHIGRPIIFTTLTISVGFSILALSSFKATAIFGVMMVITMLSALVGDLILLPSLMQHVELVTLWDLVRLKMGKEPRYGIPLFKGLSRTQVHYIIMAGSLKNLERGEILFRKGDTSDSMYAVISGGLDVVDYIKDEGPSPMHGIQKLVNQLDAGAVLGEMGLLRGVPRSATVLANTPTELLKINWKMIQRLQWLFPPTAQKFFLNLMTMLCDRVEDLSQCVADESIIDDLTGLCNRRGFSDALSVEVRRAVRYGEDLVLCLIEVNVENEQVRTDYQLMDRIFRIIGQAISREIRSCDTLGRVDAQTFGLVMTRATSSTARIMCERLERVIKAKLEAEDIAGAKFKFVTTSLADDRDVGGAEMMLYAKRLIEVAESCD